MRRYLSVREMQLELGISRAFAYKLLGLPEFPAVRLGKRVLIPEDALEAWLERQPAEGEKN